VPSKSLASPARKRQLGAERTTQPLPTVHEIPSDSKITWGRLAIIATVLAWVGYIVYTILRQFLNNGTESFRFTTEALSYVIVVTFLTFSALMYLIARQGALQRFRDHVRVPRAELDSHFASHQGSLTVLVPSYSEEPGVVRATLWSAALQEYPDLRIVLLLDDPPHPSDPVIAAQLQASRSIARDIELALAEPRARFTEALLRCESSLTRDGQPSTGAVQRLAEDYQWAALWLQAMASAETITDHVDTFFVEQVLGGLAAELSLTGAALNAAVKEGTAPSAARMLELHRRLVWTFSAELDTFERKLYASLSHDANKAMNLNAYIGLMGRRFQSEAGPDGTILRPAADDAPADFVVRDSEYLLTLDADSLLLRDYCLRLVYLLEQPDNARVAVTQTPYSSFRGAPTRIERLAGATTDIQHILHQGMSHYGATFWVGANAVIRKVALEDIVEVETVGGFEVRRYVQDRTVIEDTESSIDLGTHGWSLVNYPERLSYSATPPDFGSLIVQRRRWANGGLLILPKLWRQLRERRRQGTPISLIELALRVNYMTSIAWASFGLIFLLAYPYDSRLLSPVVVLAALPYFLAMGSDLRSCGYKFTDILRIYGFNLILLPVNLAGVLKSLQQAVTSKKIPFARTPKVRNRTAAPIMFVVVPFLIVAFSALTLWRDVSNENWGNAAFAGFNALLASFAILAYIGLWNSLVDIFLGLTQWMFVERTPRRVTDAAPAVPQPEPTLDWRAVIYHGHVVGALPDDVELVTGPFVRPTVPAKRAKQGALK
jgi:cellulose synthase (UDP-forming)